MPPTGAGTLTNGLVSVTMSDGCQWLVEGDITYSSRVSYMEPIDWSTSPRTYKLSRNYKALLWNDREYLAGANGELPNFTVNNHHDYTSPFVGGESSMSAGAIPAFHISIQPAPGEGFADTLSAAAALPGYNPANGVALRNPNNGNDYATMCFAGHDNFVDLIGLQIKSDYGSAVSNAVGHSNNFTVRNCILDGTGPEFVCAFDSGPSVLANSLVISRGSSGGVWSKYPAFILHSTIVNVGTAANTVGIVSNDKWVFDDEIISNTAVFGFAHAAAHSSSASPASFWSSRCANNVTDAPAADSAAISMPGIFTGGAKTCDPLPGGSYAVPIASAFVSSTDYRAGSALIGAGSAFGSFTVNCNSGVVCTDLTTYNFDGADIIGNARPRGSAYDVGASGPAQVAGSTTLPAFTAATVQYAGPVHPNMSEAGGAYFTNNAMAIAAVIPTDGVGPYSYAMGTNNPAGYRIRDYTRGVVAVPYGAFPSTTTDTCDVVITDGPGRTLTVTLTIDKTGAFPQLYVGAPRAQPNNLPAGGTFQSLSFPIYTYAPDQTAYGNSGNATVTDPSGHFVQSYGAIECVGSNPPPAGTYPITVSSTGPSGTLSRTAQLIITQGVIGTIYFVPVTVSTSLPAGYVVGRAYVTTPHNKPSFALTVNAGGKYGINGLTGEVYVTGNAPLTVGPDTIVIHVTDASATADASFTIAVVQGVSLPASNMALTQNALTNYNPDPASFAGPGTPQIVGTPTVSGVTGPKKWFLKDARFCLANEVAQTVAQARGDYYNRGIARYTIDPATGLIQSHAALSCPTDPVTKTWVAGTDTLTVSCTDGINTCTAVLSITINPVVGPTLHVGPGASTIYGSTLVNGVQGFEHMADWIALFQSANLGAYAGATVIVKRGPDDSYYVNDTGAGNPALRYNIHGPVAIVGDVSDGGPPVYLGGPMLGSNGGSDQSGKAFLIFADGDAIVRNFRFGYIADGSFSGDYIPQNPIAAVRQNNNVSGNLTVDNCQFFHVGDGIKTGNSDGIVTITNCEVYRGSASLTGENNHNVYLGANWKAVIDNCLFWSASPGHEFKARCVNGVVTNSRFFDTETAGGSNQLDLPSGGNWSISGCTFEKGPMPQNPFSIQYCEEFTWPNLYTPPINLLNIHNCTFIYHGPQTAAQCGAAIRHAGILNPDNGRYSRVIDANNTFIGWPSGKTALALTTQFPGLPPGDTHTFTVESSGSVLSNAFPALDLSTPVRPIPPAGSRATGRPGWWNAVADTGNHPAYGHINGVQMDPGFDDIRIPASTPVGTVIFSPVPYGTRVYSVSGNPQPDPNINPFAGGATWLKNQSPTNYTGESFGLDTTHFNVDAHTGQVTLASPITPGNHLLQLRATSVSNPARIAEFIFYIVVY